MSRLRGDLPEYGLLSRRDGPFLRGGFKVRVVHCFWTFDSLEDAAAFLGEAFGAVGREVAAGMKRPRLSYNVAVYHRTLRSAGRDRRRSRRRSISPGIVFLAIALIGSVAVRALRGHRPRRVADPAAGRRRGGRSGSCSSRSRSTRCGRPGGPASRPDRAGASGSAIGGGIAAIIGAGCVAGAIILFLLSRPPPDRARRTSGASGRSRTDPLVDSGRPVPPSSRGLGRHPFKVEIRGSNPLGGTTLTPAPPGPVARRAATADSLLPSAAMEIMGVQIRTIVKDNVASRCDGCLEVIDGTPWRVNLLDIVAAETPVAWTERPAINPGPFQFHGDPACVRRWMAGQGLPVLPPRRGPRDHAPDRRSRRDPPRWGLCDGIHRDDHEFVPA